MISDKNLGNDVYTDFSGFESMRKAARENDPKAVHTVAKQFEGIFLNMMLSSMREANQLFNEDSLMSSKDVRFYEQMLDQQLSTTLSSGRGIGLADQITRQIEQAQGKLYDPANNVIPDIQGINKPEERLANAKPNSLEYDRPPAFYELAAYRARPFPSQPAITVINSLDDNHSKSADQSEIIQENSSAQTTDLNSFSPISPQDFVEKIVPYAKTAAKKLGVPVESIVAQAALETGWGRYLIKNSDGSPALNFFGIKTGKSWPGDSVKVPTLEYRNGIAAEESALFRSYPSMDKAFDDYSNFLLQNPRYETALQTVSKNQDAKSWGNLLQTAGYATDPNYGKKIASIVSRLQKDDAFQQRLNSITSVSK
ncbi:MAG: flagellar assembly peptidoglycan hydrolase FlgJ [Pseudomonadales bacterium]|nr:flagellar assembly peptidoglycan hydrolase FlgJ [Pseudomonadales bacterium]